MASIEGIRGNDGHRVPMEFPYAGLITLRQARALTNPDHEVITIANLTSGQTTIVEIEPRGKIVKLPEPNSTPPAA